MDPHSLLQRYRIDRRRLLNFLLSSGLLRSSCGALNLSESELDTLSIKYVLDCIQSGGVFNLPEGIRNYRDELNFPIMQNSISGSRYFLLTPESSGSPPNRAAPLTETEAVSTFNISTCSTTQKDHFVGTGVDEFQFLDDFPDDLAKIVGCKLSDDGSLLLGLPMLKTGLSDADVQETAYEVLVASLILSGEKIHFSEEEKQHKKSRSLVKQRPRVDGSSSFSQEEDHPSNMLEVIRIQMEISEAMDRRTKHALRHLSSMMFNGKTNVPQITLELLTSINNSDFPSERAYVKWHERQVNVLEEVFHCCNDFVHEGYHQPLSILLSKLKNKEERFLNNERFEVLDFIRKCASSICSMPGKFGIPGETYYWTGSYCLNLRLYEKMLFSVFDVLEDAQIVEEAEEILNALKSTWSILGITPKIHDALYSWVLFQQFIRTGEAALLSNILTELNKISSQDDGSNEVYISSLICSQFHCNNEDLSLVDSVFYNINAWCNYQLEDYNMNFKEERSRAFQTVIDLAIYSGTYFAARYGEIKTNGLLELELASKLLHLYLERSNRAAYRRALDSAILKSKTEGKHYLVLLAEELKLIVGQQSATFTPVLCQHYPEAGIQSAKLIHQLYGKQLKPFLEGISHLSESVRSVLAASESLEGCLIHIMISSGDHQSLFLSDHLQLYQIRSACQPLILQWLNAQSQSILEWAKRAILIEDWAPLSYQQRHAVSIVEVFRIIEETIDQFFNLKLPMDTIHLRSLLIGITHSIEAYLQQILSQQVNKGVLFPKAPSLTRYKEPRYPFLKKKLVGHAAILEKETSQLDDLTAPKLCVKLNTLHYIREKLDSLEDSVCQSWLLVQQDCFYFAKKDQPLGTALEAASTNSIYELFTIFDDIRRTAIATSDTIIDFIGPRVVIWDMKDSFLSSLYHGSVEASRLEIFVPQLDKALNHICDLLIDILREQVVLSIFHASVDAYVWVLLEGGPSRAFSVTDVIMMQEDLDILKGLFFADGQGLPHVVVEKEAKRAQQFLDLYAIKAEDIIEMLVSGSQKLSYPDDADMYGCRNARDTGAVLRVLCHKKDKVASKYLKVHYHLPKSTAYEEIEGKELLSTPPRLSEIFKRSTTLSWNETGQSSFRMMKKKFQEATSEVRYAPW